ncbi:hypothetical protein VDGL01_12648 [Verticillium dahliae]
MHGCFPGSMVLGAQYGSLGRSSSHERRSNPTASRNALPQAAQILGRDPKAVVPSIQQHPYPRPNQAHVELGGRVPRVKDLNPHAECTDMFPRLGAQRSDGRPNTEHKQIYGQSQQSVLAV